MALIKCPECGKEISDRANICIGCGFPIQDYLKEIDEKEEKLEMAEELLPAACPFCNSVDIDDDGYCNDCGMLISSYKVKENISTVESETENLTAEELYTVCPECGKRNKVGIFTCTKCNHHYSMDEYRVIDPEVCKFQGVYKYTLLGGKQEVYCPRCRSSECSHYQEQKIVPGKIKTRYTINLNPLHPLVLVNKKEKIIRNDTIETESKFLCNKCGYIFN